MEAFVSRKRRKASQEDEPSHNITRVAAADDQTTDEKLAILSSIFEEESYEQLLEVLLNSDGSVERALETLLAQSSAARHPSRKTSAAIGRQSSLPFTKVGQPDQTEQSNGSPSTLPRSLTKRGKTLYLYSPAAIAQHTPCTIIHNFLPPALANDLLGELLPESESFTSATFKLFDNVVQSPHTACFYVDSLAQADYQKSTYLYNGSTLSDVREILPAMRKVSTLVEAAVNIEIAKRIQSHYVSDKKLKHQAAGPWIPNAAFVNCYNGAQQSVGYHTDQLSYLGPHPVIGSLSLGVQREFRIRRIVPRPASDTPGQKELDELADAQGQISLPLPHNSLLVMHAEMQETWKHSIAPAGASTGGITPHPIAGNKRINITYRWYREEFSPKYTPKCRCGVPCVLKSVMRRAETVGRYVWMCQTPGRVDVEDAENKGSKSGKGCGHFEWAEFDDDGVPMWLSEQRRKEKEEVKASSGSASGEVSNESTLVIQAFRAVRSSSQPKRREGETTPPQHKTFCSAGQSNSDDDTSIMFKLLTYLQQVATTPAASNPSAFTFTPVSTAAAFECVGVAVVDAPALATLLATELRLLAALLTAAVLAVEERLLGCTVPEELLAVLTTTVAFERIPEMEPEPPPVDDGEVVGVAVLVMTTVTDEEDACLMSRAEAIATGSRMRRAEECILCD